MRLALQFGLVSLLLSCAWPAVAQYELVTYDRPFVARSLAGIVVDYSGAPVPGAVVEECDVPFTPVPLRGPTGEQTSGVAEGDCDQDPRHVLASRTTDEGGRFVFPRAKRGSTHYLHIVSRGFDPMQIKVKLRFVAHSELRIRLKVAS
jgi:hypothetical protein